jgi:hypothetical protein
VKFYEPLFTAAVKIFDDYSDDDLRVMLDFLVRGREMVAQELAKLEKERLAGQAPDPA